MSKNFKLLILLLLSLSSCFSDSKKTYLTCKIISDNHIQLPASKQNFAIAFYKIRMRNIPQRNSMTTTSQDYREFLCFVPKNTFALINGKKYPVSVKKEYKTLLEKTFMRAPGRFPGSPKELHKGMKYKFNADSAELITQNLDLLKKIPAYFNIHFEDKINIMQHPEIDKDLRTFNIKEIYIDEYYIKNDDELNIDAEIKNDTLFLKY
jgi:hypothetical protein